MAEAGAVAGPPPEGVRWPAEWEPHRATWLAWPHNEETWPGRLPAVEAAYREMVRVLAAGETVSILVPDAAIAERLARELDGLGPAIELHVVPTDDAWIRDHGPVFVKDPAGGSRALHFGFDAWGGKYPPWERDAAVGSAVAALRRVPCHRADFVLEGGSIDGDGAGTILTTESCLLNPNREPGGGEPEGESGRTREQMERRLADWLGARRVVWLGEGIAGDDTDGHVDDLARFVAPGTVVCVGAEGAGDDAPVHAENLRRLARATDASGARLSVATLPSPPPLIVDGQRCPASYANFLVANAGVLVPVFGAASDARALAILGELFPERPVVGIPAADLVVGLGAVHCLSQQEPA
ncbi:MAG: agmatine deiminase family protein [Myxococcota bacterium]|nr:agmatine deiminase family protein [Myxococcota bacterium]